MFDGPAIGDTQIAESRSSDTLLVGQEISLSEEEKTYTLPQSKSIGSLITSKAITMCLGLPSSSSPPAYYAEENKEIPKWKKRVPKQLSIRKMARDAAWERRQRQILQQERKGVEEHPRNSVDGHITDEDLDELRGCIELGFGFKEEEGQGLCNTLPALDLYFAVNRQLSPRPMPPRHQRSSSSPSLLPKSPSFDISKNEYEAWKICSPGENPQQVKMKLRHWAQAVACSVMQSS